MTIALAGGQPSRSHPNPEGVKNSSDLFSLGFGDLAVPSIGAPRRRTILAVLSRVFDRRRLAADGWPERIVLPITEEPLLIADPKRAFGQPIFIHGGARLTDVRDRINVGESDEDVACDFGVPLDDVRSALAEASRAAA